MNGIFHDAKPLCIALTGGIASGKSATAERFARLQVPVFDADIAARAVVAPGQPALKQIASEFSADMITQAGELDRARMRARVFHDDDARHRLEKLLHPPILALLREQVRGCTSAYCVIAIPLFVEAREDYRWLQRVLVTDVPASIQIERLTRRAGIDAALAADMLAAQASRGDRLAVADDVIDNTAPLITLDAVVERLHLRYLALAG
jgi:dephospho-CoA kinase